MHSTTRYFSIINIGSGFVRGNYYRNKDTYKLTDRPIYLEVYIVIYQTNTNTNNGQNLNQISGRGGRGRGGPNSSSRGNRRNGCGNNLIAKYAFEGKIKDGSISKLTIEHDNKTLEISTILKVTI